MTPSQNLPRVSNNKKGTNTKSKVDDKLVKVYQNGKQIYINYRHIIYPVVINFGQPMVLYSNKANDKHPLNTKSDIITFTKEKWNDICKVWHIYETDKKYDFKINKDGTATIIV